MLCCAVLMYTMQSIDPHLLLLIFLPTIGFSAALSQEPHLLRRNWGQVGGMGGGGGVKECVGAWGRGQVWAHPAEAQQLHAVRNSRVAITSSSSKQQCCITTSPVHSHGDCKPELRKLPWLPMPCISTYCGTSNLITKPTHRLPRT